jgi:hypothetical protein
MKEITYSENEMLLNKLWAEKRYDEYQSLKTDLLSKRLCIEEKDVAWMRSHLLIPKNPVVIERDKNKKPIRWRSHSYLTDEELAFLTDQLKTIY